MRGLFRSWQALACGLALLAPGARGAEELELGLASKVSLKVILLDRDLQAKCGGKLMIGVVGSAQGLEVFSRLKGTAIDESRTVELAEIVALESLPPPLRLTARGDARRRTGEQPPQGAAQPDRVRAREAALGHRDPEDQPAVPMTAGDPGGPACPR
jgi:hypothetical protein